MKQRQLGFSPQEENTMLVCFLKQVDGSPLLLYHIFTRTECFNIDQEASWKFIVTVSKLTL